jgi:hypothetical protein
MHERHRVTIHGNTIAWDDGVPPVVETNEGVSGYIVLDNQAETDREPNGKRAIEFLRQIACRGGIKSIPDPVAWQREIRRDRPLPGR